MDYSLLDGINSPRDVKNLRPEKLKDLAEEIRMKIIETVAVNGGHLAPNLGVVELTIALHRALECPKDKIVWDVGHQCYVHKLLTGRRGQFETLRQYGGIAGFPKRSESPHDVFDTGHASNSLSVALGLAEARDKRGGDEAITAVIGDGALTGGEAFEALNQIGHHGTKLVVILNDNEMSIASNVGALSHYLARLRLDPVYSRFREGVEEGLKKIPAIGEHLFEVGKHVKESMKALVVPGMIFEELGFRYIGPIDGHDIEELELNIRLASQSNKPVVLHILTKKGSGYAPAELEPDRFHGTPPFERENGKAKKGSDVPTYTEVFGDTVIELAKTNESILAITAAMPSGTGLDAFAAAYPERFYDVGIAEQHAVTFAAGLALGGYLPIVAIYSTFLERAYDQLIQDVCLQGLHVVFAIDRGGIVGEDGPTHHGAFDLSYLRHIPEMVVMAPMDEAELRQMLYTATNLKGPVAIRYPRSKGVGADLAQPLTDLPVGQAEIIREGSDVCLFAIGRMVKNALATADLLAGRGVLASVVNARFAKPLDEEAISWAAKNHELIVTVEDNSVVGGFGSGVLEVVSSRRLKREVLCLGLPDEFIPHGPIDRLHADVGLDPKGIASFVMGRLDKARGGVKEEDRSINIVAEI
ncbi:MAG: 1-deoxy-D-xylulose-5-phosphate synthase [Actinobacteria bacterium]|nr:1-deoxy-D-xylulose-5-phosphate synthase [Actinomycetota bacterium]